MRKSLLLCCGLVAALAVSAPLASAQGTNVILDWNQAFNKIIRGAPAGNVTTNPNTYATFFDVTVPSQPASRVREEGRIALQLSW